MAFEIEIDIPEGFDATDKKQGTNSLTESQQAAGNEMEITEPEAEQQLDETTETEETETNEEEEPDFSWDVDTETENNETGETTKEPTFDFGSVAKEVGADFKTKEELTAYITDLKTKAESANNSKNELEYLARNDKDYELYQKTRQDLEWINNQIGEGKSLDANLARKLIKNRLQNAKQFSDEQIESYMLNKYEDDITAIIDAKQQLLLDKQGIEQSLDAYQNKLKADRQSYIKQGIEAANNMESIFGNIKADPATKKALQKMIDTPLVQVSIPVEVAKQLFPKGKDGSMNWQAVVQSLALAGITSNPKRLEMFTEVIKSKAKKDAFDAFTVKSKPTVKGKSKKTISSNEADYVLDMEATSKRGRRS